MKLKNRKYQLQEYYKLYARGVQGIKFDEDSRKLQPLLYNERAFDMNWIEYAINYLSSMYKLTGSDIYSKKGIVGVLEPLQQRYNLLCNDLIRELYLGEVLLTEDGSIDTQKIEEEGLSPGKILLYRQGAVPPTFMNNTDKIRLLQVELEHTESLILKHIKVFELLFASKEENRENGKKVFDEI